MGEACNNGVLKHVDLSYNSMDKSECEVFGLTIHSNHSLWGLHLMGNDCIIDSMGFVRAGVKKALQSRDILHSPISNGIDFICKLRSSKVASYQNCWVCEGWSEHKFEWRFKKSGLTAKEPAYIHFDFD